MVKFKFLEEKDIEKCLQISGVNHYNELLDVAKFDMTSSLIVTQFVKPEFLILENDKEEVIAFAGYANSGFDMDIYSVFWGNINPKYRTMCGLEKKEIASMFLLKIKEKVLESKGEQIICTSRFINFLGQFGFKELKNFGRESLLMWDLKGEKI